MWQAVHQASTHFILVTQWGPRSYYPIFSVICLHGWTHAHTCACLPVCTKCAHVDTSVFFYISTCKQIYTSVCLHTYMYMYVCTWPHAMFLFIIRTVYWAHSVKVALFLLLFFKLSIIPARHTVLPTSGSTNCSPQAKFSPSLVFENKVLLEHSHMFVYVSSIDAFTLQWQSWAVY